MCIRYACGPGSARKGMSPYWELGSKYSGGEKRERKQKNGLHFRKERRGKETRKECRRRVRVNPEPTEGGRMNQRIG